MSFSSGQTKLSEISGCPYLPGVRRAGFHCISQRKIILLFRSSYMDTVFYPLYSTHLLGWKEEKRTKQNILSEASRDKNRVT